MTTEPETYPGYRFPAEVIHHAIWLYHVFSLSLRDVELILAERGITVTRDSIRQWCLKFGADFASKLRRRRPKPGTTWDRRVLADGEGPAINAATLVWHLIFAEGDTLRTMSDAPQVRAFRTLLSALAADRRGLAAEHEAKRRRWVLRNVGVKRRTEARPAGWHRQRLASKRPSPRFAMSRLEQDAFPVRPVPRSHHAHDEAAAAVRMALCTDPADDTGDLSKFAGTLFGNRYVHDWLMRHRHVPPDPLITILSEALDVSRAKSRGILLPAVPHAAELVLRAGCAGTVHGAALSAV